MLKPKKSNKIEWDVESSFVHEGESTESLYPAIFAYNIKNRNTEQLRWVSKEIVDKMKFLGVIEVPDRYKYQSFVTRVDKFTFGYSTDDSFLGVYIDGRPTWDEYFMANAKLISTRSTCDRLFVGAVIVKDNRIIGEGYNGSIAGHPHCDEVGHLMYEGGCKRTVHAEANALQNCTVDPKGAIIYVTHYPCPDCMKALNQAGIAAVIYGEHYKHRYENNFNAGMVFRQFSGKRLKIEWEGE